MIVRANNDHIEMLARAALGVLDDLPNYAGVTYDIEHSRKMLETYLCLPDLGCFIEIADGEVVGMFMGMVHPQWFTPTLEFSELMFWVRSDYRKTSLARQLMKSAEEFAISRGAKKLIVAAASGYQTERVEKFYNRLGYHTCALMTCKEV